jgi:mycobactin lysine-N-oxygenase
MTAPPLLVIGAGAKAAALAAKSRVIRELGEAAPAIFVVDNVAVAANWSGKHGFTDGRIRLGTPPEKDIGFPYRLDASKPEIQQQLFAVYSWLSYKTLRKREYSEWIDRGRPHPTHAEWAEYLSWVLSRTADKIIIGNIKRIDMDGNIWRVTIEEDGTEKCYEVGGIVVTSPGDRKAFEISMQNHPRVLYGDDFWLHRINVLNRLVAGKEELPIVIIGGGETAASIVGYVLDQLEHRDLRHPIIVCTRTGTIFTRGEGYDENRMFTSLERWRSLPESVRMDVIRRCDRGVFSREMVHRLALAQDVEHRFFEVIDIKVSPLDSNIIRIIGGSGSGLLEAQFVIFAMGFDPFAFQKYFNGRIQNIFKDRRQHIEIERAIGHDLSVCHPEISAKLFLPMLAGLAQGPGFPNLSCLGELSDRILGRHDLRSGNPEDNGVGKIGDRRVGSSRRLGHKT